MRIALHKLQSVKDCEDIGLRLVISITSVVFYDCIDILAAKLFELISPAIGQPLPEMQLEAVHRLIQIGVAQFQSSEFYKALVS